MIIEDAKNLTIEELIETVRATKTSKHLRKELNSALRRYRELNPCQRRILGGLIPGVVFPPDLIDFLGFGRVDLRVEGLKRVGDCACIYSKNAYMSGINQVGSSAFVCSEDGAMSRVKKVGNYFFGSSFRGTAYRVDMVGAEAFFAADEIRALVGHVEEIYDPKSGIIIAEKIGRVIFEENNPSRVKIFATEVIEGKEHVTPVKSDILRTLKFEGDSPPQSLRKKIEIFAKAGNYEG